MPASQTGESSDQSSSDDGHTPPESEEPLLGRAGDGNRTRAVSLGSWSSTIELRPHRPNYYIILLSLRIGCILVVDVFLTIPRMES